MKTIEIPYYTSHQELHVDEKNLKAVIRAKMHEFKTEKTEAEIVKEAMDNPIGTPKLEELAKGKHNVVIVTSDHTRAVPSKITLPLRNYHSHCDWPASSHNGRRTAQNVWRRNRRP